MNSRISCVITTISLPRRRIFHIGIAQDAQALARANFVRRIGVGREAIFAQAQEGEIVGAQPLQNWLASAISSIGSGGGLELKVLIACSTRARMARQSVTQARTSLSVLARPSISFWRSASGVQTGDVEMDQAFALGPLPPLSAFRRRNAGAALIIALHGDDRVGDQRDFDALLSELRHGGIEQEGHVVVENFEHGNLAPSGIIGLITRISTARRALLHMFQACCARKARERHRSWRGPR